MAENISNDLTKNSDFSNWAQEFGLSEETTKNIAVALGEKGYTPNNIRDMTDRSLNEFLDKDAEKLNFSLPDRDKVERFLNKIRTNPDQVMPGQPSQLKIQENPDQVMPGQPSQQLCNQPITKEFVGQRCVNIAVIGYAKSGKSTFIQAMRGERCSEDAPPSPWIDPIPDLIRPYDIPGTRIFLWEIQLKEGYESDLGSSLPYHQYSWYSAFVFCSQVAFFDKTVVKILQQKNPVLYFVRTNVDLDLENCIDDNIQNFNPTEQKKKIRQEAQNHLETNKPIYLINSKVPNEHDFQLIKEKITVTERTEYAHSLTDKLLPTVIPKATELCRMGKFDKNGITKEIRNYEERFGVTLQQKDDLRSYFDEFEKMQPNANVERKSKSHIHWTIHILAKYLRRCELAYINSLKK